MIGFVVPRRASVSLGVRLEWRSCGPAEKNTRQVSHASQSQTKSVEAWRVFW